MDNIPLYKYFFFDRSDFIELINDIEDEAKRKKMDFHVPMNDIITIIFFNCLYGISFVEIYNLFNFTFVKTIIKRKENKGNVDVPNNDKIRKVVTSNVIKIFDVFNIVLFLENLNEVKNEIIIKFIFNEKVQQFLIEYDNEDFIKNFFL